MPKSSRGGMGGGGGRGRSSPRGGGDTWRVELVLEVGGGGMRRRFEDGSFNLTRVRNGRVEGVVHVEDLMLPGKMR